MAIPMVERLPPVQVAYLLFFDGGSRSNPGPGGSGSIILQVDIDMGRTTIVWVASMSYSHSTTTNNMAEYCGLLMVYGTHTTINASLSISMIIRQQTPHVPPKKARLALLYHKTKRYANAMRISSWAHHFRAYNKMADMAANHAMNRVMSSQYPFPTTRIEGDKIQQYMENDVGHWFNMAHGQQRAS
uniref:RNase H type-1 domain-containing protein n=1 Tax=Globisporangium ultimum (strain ATCC 200006 / CBS 805.95 / DAOM BR144) TaxID=431595 RepID=K3X6V9_GLOUD